MQAKKVHAFDALKGIAIIGVLLRHFMGFGTAPYITKIAVGCDAFVNVFFLISAYLAFAGLDRSKGTRRWYLKKYLRLAPQFYAACAVFGVLTWIGFYNAYAEYWRGGAPISLLNILEHITMTISLSPSAKCGIIGVEWYVGVLAILLAVTPLLRKLLTNFKRALTSLLIVTAIVAAGKYFLVRGYPEEDLFRKFFENCSPFNHISTWLTGCCIYLAGKEGRFDQKSASASRLLAIGAGVVFLAQALLNEFIAPGVLRPIVADVFGLLLVLSALRAPSDWRARPLEFLGRHSYGIYLWHFLVIVLYVSIAGNVPVFGAIWTILFTIGACAAAIPISLALEWITDAWAVPITGRLLRRTCDCRNGR